MKGQNKKMNDSPFETYLYADACIFFLLFIYSLIRFIFSLCATHIRYASQITFRSLITMNSISFTILLLVSRFTRSQIAYDAMQVLVIFFSNAVCLAFFYSILEFDSICREYLFRPCRLNTIYLVIILLISVTGLCQLCSYFIRTSASPYVFFFLNSMSLFVQMEFVLGYASFHIGMTIRDLANNLDIVNDNITTNNNNVSHNNNINNNNNNNNNSNNIVNINNKSFYKCPQICITVAIVTLAVAGVSFFGTFVASFCVSLDEPFFYKLFSGLCGRAPLIVCTVTALLFQELMDMILRHVRKVPHATSVELI